MWLALPLFFLVVGGIIAILRYKGVFPLRPPKRPVLHLSAQRLFVTCAPGQGQDGTVLTFPWVPPTLGSSGHPGVPGHFSDAPTVFPLPVQQPTALLHDANGYLYVAAGYPDSAIFVYAPNASPGDSQKRRITSLANPSGICLDAQGNLYVADAGLTGQLLGNVPSAVYKFSPNADGKARPITTFQLPPDNTAVAYGVAVDGQGTVLVAAGRPVNGSGAGLFVYAPGSNANPKQVLEGFSNPQQLAFDADGNLYETMTNPQPQVTVFSPPDYTQHPLAITSPVFQDPYGVAVDGQGKIYVADRGAQAVFVFAKVVGQDVQQAQLVQTLNVAPLVPYGLDWSPFP